MTDRPPQPEETVGPIRPRRFSRGGELAAFCAMAAPWLGAGWASFLVLVPPPRDVEPILPQASGFSWLLCASAWAGAWLMWRMIRAGIRFGTMSPFRLLAAGALPWVLGLVLTPVALFQMWRYGIMQGATIDLVVEPALAPQLTGLVAGSQLLGAAGFALAVAGFLWRSPGRRWPGLWRVLAALVPFTAFVVIWMAMHTVVPLTARAEWIMFALLTLPLRYALAGAVVTRPSASEPGVQWALVVPLAGALLFMAGAALHVDQLLGRAFTAISPADGVQAWPNFIGAVESAALFGLLGFLLILLPEGVLLARHHGPGRRFRDALLGHGRILLLGATLVLLGSLADWHLATLMKDIVLAQPWAQPKIEEVAPEPRISEAAPSPRRPRTSGQVVIPRNVPEDKPPPTSENGLPPGTEVESAEADRRAIVAFVQLAERAIHRPEFRIPDSLESELRQQNQTKVVITVKLLVGEDGSIDDVVLLKGSGLPEVDEHAVETAREWRFRPFMVNNVPTAVASSWTVIYQLQ